MDTKDTNIFPLCLFDRPYSYLPYDTKLKIPNFKASFADQWMRLVRAIAFLKETRHEPSFLLLDCFTDNQRFIHPSELFDLNAFNALQSRTCQKDEKENVWTAKNPAPVYVMDRLGSRHWKFQLETAMYGEKDVTQKVQNWMSMSKRQSFLYISPSHEFPLLFEGKSIRENSIPENIHEINSKNIHLSVCLKLYENSKSVESHHPYTTIEVNGPKAMRIDTLSLFNQLFLHPNTFSEPEQMSLMNNILLDLGKCVSGPLVHDIPEKHMIWLPFSLDHEIQAAKLQVEQLVHAQVHVFQVPDTGATVQEQKLLMSVLRYGTQWKMNGCYLDQCFHRTDLHHILQVALGPNVAIKFLQMPKRQIPLPQVYYQKYLTSKDLGHLFQI